MSGGGNDPGIAPDIEMIDKKSATLLDRVDSDGGVAGLAADAVKGGGIRGIGFGADQFSIGGTAPEIGTGGMEKSAGKSAEGTDELTRIGALESSPREFQKKSLKRLVRVRRIVGARVSGIGVQWPPIVKAKRLKTIELLLKSTFVLKMSQANSRGSADLGNATKVIQVSHFAIS